MLNNFYEFHHNNTINFQDFNIEINYKNIHNFSFMSVFVIDYSKNKNSYIKASAFYI
jgi:hypothetical protein